MFFQLGDKQFKGSYSPTSWSSTGNDAVYAQLQLINGKPRLQKTGDQLETVSLSIKLRPEYCIPAAELKDLEAWQAAGEILPLLLGNGQYVKDFVIQNISRQYQQCLDDGTPVELDLNVTLLEYVAYSKAEQENLAARKKALAVGDKEQIVKLPAQPKTPEADAHAAIMQSITEMNDLNAKAETAVSSSNPEAMLNNLKQRAEKCQNALTSARNKVQTVQNTIQGGVNIYNSIINAGGMVAQLQGLLSPPLSLYSLRESITNVRGASALVNSSSLTFLQNILLRTF